MIWSVGVVWYLDVLNQRMSDDFQIYLSHRGASLIYCEDLRSPVSNAAVLRWPKLVGIATDTCKWGGNARGFMRRAADFPDALGCWHSGQIWSSADALLGPRETFLDTANALSGSLPHILVSLESPRRLSRRTYVSLISTFFDILFPDPPPIVVGRTINRPTASNTMSYNAKMVH